MPAERREQGKAERRARIVASATRLFAEHGYDAVTTRQVAQAAGVGMGTLFRHAGSKPALLVLVMNARLEQGAQEGRAVLAAGGSVGAGVAAVVGPIVAEGVAHPQNVRAYQRETLFGPEPARELATARLVELERTVTELLTAHVDRVGSRPGVDLVEVARLIDDVVTTELVRAGAGRTRFEDVAARVERAADVLVAGLVEPRP